MSCNLFVVVNKMMCGTRYNWECYAHLSDDGYATVVKGLGYATSEEAHDAAKKHEAEQLSEAQA